MLMVILLFITLVKAAPQLHQQEQENGHHLNPINDAAAKDEAAKLQNKRTLLGATHYIPRHVGVHPLGFRYLLGYGPIANYPYARPAALLRPVVHHGVKSHLVHPVVNIQPTQHLPVQPIQQPIQPVVPEPERVIPVHKHIPEPVVPITPVHHFQPQVYPFYKPLGNQFIPQPNLIHPVPQPNLVQHLVPQPQLVPQNLVPQSHFIPQQHHHFIQPVQQLIPHQVRPFIPQPVNPIQSLIPQHIVPQNPLYTQVPLAQLPPPLLHILKSFPQLQIFKHITPLYPVNPPQAEVHHPQQFIPEVPRPFVPHATGEGGVIIQFPQHQPEFPQQAPQFPQHAPEFPQVHQNVPEYPQNIPQYPQNIPQYPQNIPEPPQFHPDINSGQDVSRPDFSTNQQGQSDPMFHPVHTHPQTPLYLPPHPNFRPVANPIEPTNSVQSEFSATYPKHHLVSGLQHPALSLEPPYSSTTHVNINKH